MTEPPDDPPKSVEAAAEAAIVGAGFLLGDGPVGAMAGAVAGPYITDLVRRTWDEITGLRQGSVTGLVAVAAEHLGVEPQQVLAGAMTTQGGTELLADAFHAAADTVNQRKVEALARALANGIADDQALIDQERLVVRALADLEEPHLAFLVKLAGENPQRWGDRIVYPSIPMPTINSWYAPWGQRPPRGIVEAIMHTLERNGLIEDNAPQRLAERDKQARKRMDSELKRVEPKKRGVAKTGRPPSRPERAPAVMWKVTDFGGLVLEHLTSDLPQPPI